MRIVIIALFFLCSCAKENEYALRVTTESENPYYLYKYEKGTFITVDSSYSKNGIHDFNIKPLHHEILWCGENQSNCFVFIAKPSGKCEVTVDAFDVASLKITLDSNNILLNDFFQKRQDQINRITTASEIAKKELIPSYYDFMKDFIDRNKTSPAILMTLNDIQQNPFPFKNEILFIKNVIEKKFKNETYLKQVNQLLQYVNQQENLLAQQEQREKEEREIRKNLGLNIGDVAPDIRLQSPKGKTYQLSDLKGKVVLLDFWASWCRPCRAENPNVVRIYENNKAKGFTVFSVSLDQKKDSWENAIKADNLSWPYHVSDLAGWNSVAAQKYGIRSIPSTFLLNKENRIVAYNLRGEELAQKIKALLNG